MIPLIIQDQFYTIQNLQRPPIPQTSNWSGTFICCFLQQTGSSISIYLKFQVDVRRLEEPLGLEAWLDRLVNILLENAKDLVFVNENQNNFYRQNSMFAPTARR